MPLKPTDSESFLAEVLRNQKTTIGRPAMLAEFFEAAMRTLATAERNSRMEFVIDNLPKEQLKKIRTRTPQDKCDHLKGNSGPRVHAKDHSVYHHTFPDGKVHIRCMRCGKIWTPDNADWVQAVLMTEQSTNAKSSSEVVLFDSKWQIQFPVDGGFEIRSFKTAAEANIFRDGFQHGMNYANAVAAQNNVEEGY